jgi:hypothetical protein
MISAKETQLAKDSLWVLAARLCAQGALALFTILIARRLGSAGFGEYAFIASAVFIGNMLTTFGTDMLLDSRDRRPPRLFATHTLPVLAAFTLVCAHDLYLGAPVAARPECGRLAGSQNLQPGAYPVCIFHHFYLRAARPAAHRPLRRSQSLLQR